MSQRLARHVRVFAVFTTLLALALPGAPALAQSTSTTQIWIDTPTANATLQNGVQTDIGGWAINPAGPGTGVDTVRVYLDSTMDNASAMVGTAEMGVSRPDVAASFRNSAYTYSGYNLLWTPSNVSPGSHTLYVYAHAASGWTSKTVSVTVQGQQAMEPSMQNRGPYGDQGYYGDNGNYRGGDSMYSRYRADAPRWGIGYPGGYLGGYYNYPGYYNGMYPPYTPNYPMYPSYPYYPGSGQACIMIYPPPPGC